MTEERKHAILFAATLLCARRIIELIDAKDHAKMGKRRVGHRIFFWVAMARTKHNTE